MLSLCLKYTNSVQSYPAITVSNGENESFTKLHISQTESTFFSQNDAVSKEKQDKYKSKQWFCATQFSLLKNMNHNLFPWPMTQRHSNSDWEPHDLWCVKTVFLTLIQQRTAEINLTNAWKFKVRTKNQKRIKFHWRWEMDRAHKYFHTWRRTVAHRSQHASLFTTWGSNRKSNICTWESRHEAFKTLLFEQRPLTWSAWLLLPTQIKGFKKKVVEKKKLLSCWSLKILLKESWKYKELKKRNLIKEKSQYQLRTIKSIKYHQNSKRLQDVPLEHLRIKMENRRKLIPMMWHGCSLDVTQLSPPA